MRSTLGAGTVVLVRLPRDGQRTLIPEFADAVDDVGGERPAPRVNAA